VKVALLVPMSGKHADLGQAMMQSAQLALFDMGYDKIELMPQDTKGTPEGARVAAQQALNDGAQLILGPVFAGEARAVAPIAQQRNVNVITFSTDWTLAQNNVFVMGFLPFTQVERIVQYAAAPAFAAHRHHRAGNRIRQHRRVCMERAIIPLRTGTCQHPARHTGQCRRV
jgi:branched-chain amino acid transport system substrate-binding protein